MGFLCFPGISLFVVADRPVWMSGCQKNPYHSTNSRTIFTASFRGSPLPNISQRPMVPTKIVMYRSAVVSTLMWPYRSGSACFSSRTA